MLWHNEFCLKWAPTSHLTNLLIAFYFYYNFLDYDEEKDAWSRLKPN